MAEFERPEVDLPSQGGRHPHPDHLVGEILDRIADVTQHLDHQINILIGISSALFLFVAAALEHDQGNIPLIIIGVFAAGSALGGLIAVHPPRYTRKHNQPESMLYNKRIASMPSAAAYTAEIKKICHDPDAIINEVSTEIYNLAKYYYRPKREIFHFARHLLFIGLALGLTVFLATNLVQYLPVGLIAH